MFGSGTEKHIGSRRAARLPKIATISVVFLLALTYAGCMDDYGPLEALRKLPEGSLYYPSARVVQEISGPRKNGPDYRSGAEYGHFLAVNATPDQVIAFYDGALTARGWTRSTRKTHFGALGNAEWTKPGLWMRVWIDPAASSSVPTGLRLDYSGFELSVRAFVQEDWPTESPS